MIELWFVYLLTTIVILQNLFLGGLWGRVDGGGIWKVSEWVERLLVMSYFVISVMSYTHGWSVLALVGILGIATGHGQYFLHLPAKYITPERVDFIVKLVFGADPRTLPETPNLQAAMETYGLKRLYWRCVFGLFLTGSMVGLPAAIIALSYGHYLSSLCLSLTGFAKAGGYMLGYKLFKNTESAEWFNGSFRTALALIALTLALTFNL